MPHPRPVIADEPVSTLDVSIQTQVLNLLMGLHQETSVAYLFIAHNLVVVEHIADDMLVMYLGRVVECGPKRMIFDTPAASLHACAAFGHAPHRCGAAQRALRRQG